MSSFKLPPTPELVTVTVDGVEFKLPKGKNLLQALLDAGVYVPHYCYHPALSVAGNCRLCLVEIEGRPKPEVSCNMVASDGLKIKVNSPLVEDCRKGMMEFLLVNHPLDCPICDRGGECMLQRYSMDYGTGTARTVDTRRRFEKPNFDPLIDIERNRCIMCTRCVRFSDEVAGEHVMGVFGHGNRNYIGTFGNGPVGNVFSGNVIDLCPVGCLTSKPYRFKARPWELRQTLTTTRTCNGAVTAWTRGGRLYRVTPPVRRRRQYFTLDEDTTQFISNEARFGSHHVNNPARLLEPLVRQGVMLGRASWDEALRLAADALRAAAPAEVCFLAGERGSNEEFFLLSRLARSVVGTPNIDWRLRFTSEAAAQAAGVALAAGTGDFDLLDKKAYSATLLINADLLGAAPDIALRLREAARLGHTRLGLIGSRDEAWFAKLAETVYLEQPEALAVAVDALAESITAGIAPTGFETLFNFLTKNEQGLIVLGLDNSGGELNPALVPAVLRLMKALGSSWHFLPVTAARNAKGAFGCGAQSDRLATGPLADAEGRVRLREIWGGPEPVAQPGPAAPELLRRAAQGQFKVLFLHRADELVNHPQRELVEKAIRATPTVIMLDVFPSWISELATVVLPGAVFFETDGSMTDIDGTLQRLSQGSRPAGQAQEDWRIIESLSLLLGAHKRHEKAHEVFADLVAAWQAPEGFRLDDLKLEGPGEETPQRSHLYIGQRSRPSFKLNFGEQPLTDLLPVIASLAPAPAVGKDTLRLLWINHAQGPDHLGSRSTEFDALRPQPRIELSPADAARLGLAEGDWVRLEGGAERPSQIQINPYVASGVIFGAANVLGLRLTDHDTGLPAVRLCPTQAPARATVSPAPEEVEVSL